MKRNRRIRLIVLSAILGLIAIGDLWLQARAISGFVAEDGRVIGSTEWKCESKRRSRLSSGVRTTSTNPCWKKIVEYRVSPTETRTITSDAFFGSKPEVNQTVKVLVNRMNRRDAFIGGATGYWFRPAITTGLAIAVLLMTVLLQGFDTAGASRRRRLKLEDGQATD